MKNKWNIGFEWGVSGMAVIGVIFLLLQSGEERPAKLDVRSLSSNGP